MDHIDTYLATTIQDRTTSAGLQGALALGKRTLNRYYDKTDFSEIYRIAMGAFIYFMYYYNSFFYSTTSSPQVTIFQECWMGRRLD